MVISHSYQTYSGDCDGGCQCVTNLGGYPRYPPRDFAVEKKQEGGRAGCPAKTGNHPPENKFRIIYPDFARDRICTRIINLLRNQNSPPLSGLGCFRLLIALFNLTCSRHGHVEDIFLYGHIASRIADSYDNKYRRSTAWHSRGWVLCLERHLQGGRCTAPGSVASLHSHDTLTWELERGQSRGRDELLIALNLHDNRIRFTDVQR